MMTKIKEKSGNTAFSGVLKRVLSGAALALALGCAGASAGERADLAADSGGGVTSGDVSSGDFVGPPQM